MNVPGIVVRQYHHERCGFRLLSGRHCSSVCPGRLVQRAKTTGANLHTLNFAINKQGLLVDVGLEAGLGMPVGMADVVTAHS
jgi:hypothetical protein